MVALRITSIKMNHKLSHLNQTSCSVEYTVAHRKFIYNSPEGMPFRRNPLDRHSQRYIIFMQDVPQLLTSRKVINRMIVITVIFFIGLVFTIVAYSQDSQFPGGIVYGPKTAFQISAPKNWVLDNESGLSMGLPCVLYVSGSTWKDSPVIMYSKIASPNYPEVEGFIKFAIAEFIKEDSHFVHKRLEPHKIDSTFSAVVYDYQGGVYQSFERTAYIQVPNAVCYVVFSARNKKDFQKYADALYDVLDSFKLRPEYINHK